MPDKPHEYEASRIRLPDELNIQVGEQRKRSPVYSTVAQDVIVGALAQPGGEPHGSSRGIRITFLVVVQYTHSGRSYYCTSPRLAQPPRAFNVARRCRAARTTWCAGDSR